MKILIINTGSSSLKYTLFNDTLETRLVTGAIEQISEPQGQHSYTITGVDGNSRIQKDYSYLSDHRMALP